MMGAGIDGWRILAAERRQRREQRNAELQHQEHEDDRVTMLEWIGAAVVCWLLLAAVYEAAKGAGAL